MLKRLTSIFLIVVILGSFMLPYFAFATDTASGWLSECNRQGSTMPDMVNFTISCGSDQEIVSTRSFDFGEQYSFTWEGTADSNSDLLTFEFSDSYASAFFLLVDLAVPSGFYDYLTNNRIAFVNDYSQLLRWATDYAGSYYSLGDYSIDDHTGQVGWSPYLGFTLCDDGYYHLPFVVSAITGNQSDYDVLKFYFSSLPEDFAFRCRLNVFGCGYHSISSVSLGYQAFLDASDFTMYSMFENLISPYYDNYYELPTFDEQLLNTNIYYGSRFTGYANGIENSQTWGEYYGECGGLLLSDDFASFLSDGNTFPVIFSCSVQDDVVGAYGIIRYRFKIGSNSASTFLSAVEASDYDLDDLTFSVLFPEYPAEVMYCSNEYKNSSSGFSLVDNLEVGNRNSLTIPSDYKFLVSYDSSDYRFGIIKECTFFDLNRSLYKYTGTMQAYFTFSLAALEDVGSFTNYFIDFYIASSEPYTFGDGSVVGGIDDSDKYGSLTQTLSEIKALLSNSKFQAIWWSFWENYYISTIAWFSSFACCVVILIRWCL